MTFEDAGAGGLLDGPTSALSVNLTRVLFTKFHTSLFSNQITIARLALGQSESYVHLPSPDVPA